MFVSTSTLVWFSKNLKDLKPLLRGLGKEKLGDLTHRTREAHDDLCAKQATTLQNPSPLSVEEKALAIEKWQLLADFEEGYLRQKAKVHWLNVEDQNNAYFY